MRCPGQKTSYRPCVRHTEEPRDVSGFWLVTDQFHLPRGLNSGCVTAWRPLSKERKCMPDTCLRPLATPQRPVCSTPKHRPYPLTPRGGNTGISGFGDLLCRVTHGPDPACAAFTPPEVALTSCSWTADPDSSWPDPLCSVLGSGKGDRG